MRMQLEGVWCMTSALLWLLSGVSAGVVECSYQHTSLLISSHRSRRLFVIALYKYGRINMANSEDPLKTRIRFTYLDYNSIGGLDLMR